MKKEVNNSCVDVQTTDNVEFDVPTYDEFVSHSMTDFPVGIKITREEYEYAIDVLVDEVGRAIKYDEGNTRDLGGGLVGLYVADSTMYFDIIRQALAEEMGDYNAHEEDIAQMYPSIISQESYRRLETPGHIDVIAIHNNE